MKPNLCLLVLMLSLTACLDTSHTIKDKKQSEGRGSHLYYKDNLIVRTHCPNDGCLNKKEWVFTKDEVVASLRRRFEFEYANAIKVKKSTDKLVPNLEKKIQYFGKMRTAELESILSKELENGFKDEKLRLFIFAGTDSIIFERESTDTRNENSVSASCLEIKYCSDYEDTFKKCLDSQNKVHCEKFIELFKKLSAKKNCLYEGALSLDSIPAIWKCDEGREYSKKTFIRACMLLDELIVSNQNARIFYTSPQFQEVLSGESAEAFRDKSIALKKYYEMKNLTPDELYTAENNKALENISIVYELGAKEWELLIGYLTVKMPKGGKVTATSIPNYDSIAKVIVKRRDSFLMKLYFNFILATQSSADEMRSFGLGRIYDVLPEKFLNILSNYEVHARKELIKSLAGGIVSTKGPISKKADEKKLMKVFPSRENVYKTGYKHFLLAKNILKEVLSLSSK